MRASLPSLKCVGEKSAAPISSYYPRQSLPVPSLSPSPHAAISQVDGGLGLGLFSAVKSMFSMDLNKPPVNSAARNSRRRSLLVSSMLLEEEKGKEKYIPYISNDVINVTMSRGRAKSGNSNSKSFSKIDVDVEHIVSIPSTIPVTLGRARRSFTNSKK